MIWEEGEQICQLSASTETPVIYLTWDLESHLYNLSSCTPMQTVDNTLDETATLIFQNL